MTRGAPIVVGVYLVVLVAATAVASPAFAGGFHGRGVGNRVIVGPRPFAPHPSMLHHVVRHGFAARPVFRPGIAFPFVSSPVVVYATSPVYAPAIYSDPAPAYVSAPMVYSPPPGGAVSVAPSPPTPSVVQFPTGRYELRGDGMTTPYTWVWIPNPPTEPPATPPGDGPASEVSAPPRHSRFYRWTDEQGVVHLTDDRETGRSSSAMQAAPAPPR